MKKIISSLTALFVLSILLVMPTNKSYAMDCNAVAEDVKDYTVKINTDVYFRKTIQGAAEDNCPVSEVLGSFGVGQVVWVVGEIETGVIINEETKEYGKWLYIEHPTTKEYGYVWSVYGDKTDIPAGQENHQEVVVAGAISPVTEQKECEVISETTDFFVKANEGLNIRDGVCNGKIISSLGIGDVVKVIGKIGEWYYIQIPGGGKGFITSQYATVVPAPLGRENEPEVTIGADEKAIIGQPPVAPLPTSGSTLKDVVGHPYEIAIRYLEKNGVVEGYPDGLFKADIFINRAEFTKIVVQAKLKAEPFSSASDCFPDVSKTAWYASYVCYAKDSGIISGYPDLTFKPGDNINFVEAAKILVRTFGLQVDTQGDVWYQTYVEALQKNNYIPSTITKFDQRVNRGELSEMIWRILEKINNKASTQFDFNASVAGTPPPAQTADLAMCTDKHLASSIDMKKVRTAWLELNNNIRKQKGAVALVPQDGLNYSSSLWAQQNKQDGALTHIRKEQSVTDWFQSIGVTFKQVSGFVYGENIGVQNYTCNEADCSDEVMAATKSIFDAFVKESGTASTKHYDNIVRPDFKQLGMGIAIDTVNNKLYLTTHYAQAVETYPTTCK